MNFKNFKKSISVAIICSIISAVFGFWIFELDWPFLPFPILSGLFISIVQKETKSYKFLDKLVIGSLIFGFLSILLIFTRMYLASQLFHDTGFPFWPTYNTKEYIEFSLIFSFISFMGGLVGIVMKGFYYIFYKK